MIRRALILMILLCLSASIEAVAAPPYFMTVQGRLTDDSGNPLPAGEKTFVFRIFPSMNGGAAIWPNAPSGDVQPVYSDSSGLWTARVGGFIPLTDLVFSASERWLEIIVDGTTLPRTIIATSPYAFRVATVDGATGGTITGDVNLNSGNLMVGSGHTSTGLNVAVAGESNTASGDQSSAMGGSDNSATGLRAGTVAGQSNEANGDWSAVIGGTNNTANTISSVAIGGIDNSATGPYAATFGGSSNIASGQLSVVSGGENNRATFFNTAVLGGQDDTASGLNAIAVGGHGNLAFGANSFAAGQRARSINPGSFVWSDGSAGQPFSSTADNQFLIHAGGGVGIGTNTPEGELHVRRLAGFGATAHPFSIGVFEGDSSGPSYLSVLSPNTQERGLIFGDESSSENAGIIYNSLGSPDGFAFRVNGNVDLMKLTSGGFLAIGNLTTPHSNIIQVPNNANGSGQGLANAWTTYSSRRWKDNIYTIEGALGKVLRLRGVTYDAKDSGVHCLGLVAEEVGQVIPEVVTYEENGVDAQSLDYARLVPLLIEGMKEQQRQIDELKASLQAAQP